MRLLLLLMIMFASPALAQNDPGHDTLYIEQQGNSSLNGSLNISTDLKVAERIFSDYLDIRGDAVFSGTTNRIIGTSTDLYIESTGNIIINDQIGTTNTLHVGYTGDAVDLNVTGTLIVGGASGTIAGSSICTANNGLCAGSGGTAGGWTNTSSTVRLTNQTANVNITTLYINNTNSRVGIGTYNPSELLEVQGDISGAVRLKVVNQRHEDAVSTTYLEFSGGTSATEEVPMAFLIAAKDQTWTTTGSTQDSSLALHTTLDGTATERMRITSAGNVGIGTNNPNTTLHVDGRINVTSGNDICISGGNCLSTVSGGGGSSGGGWTNTTTVVSLNDANDNVSAGTLTIDNTKSFVGIGDSTPSTVLEVVSRNTLGSPTLAANTVATFIRNNNFDNVGISLITNDTASIRFGDTQDEDIGAILYDHNDNHMAFRVNAINDVMHIDSTGNVGIGTTTPDQELVVRGHTLTGDMDNYTQVYSSYANQRNIILEVGNKTATTLTTGYASLVLSKNLSSTSGFISIIQFANNNISDGSDKRTAAIASSTEGAVNTGNLHFYTSNAGAIATRMEINGSGNVRITGLTDCDTIDTDSDGDLVCGSDAGGANGWIDSGTVISLETSSDNVSAGVLHVDNKNSRIGIGTTNPGSILHINGTGVVEDIVIETNETDGRAGLRMKNDVQEWRIRVDGNDADSFRIKDVTSGTFPFKIEPTTPTNTLYLDSTGNIGLGTANPSNKLYINDTASVTATFASIHNSQAAITITNINDTAGSESKLSLGNIGTDNVVNGAANIVAGKDQQWTSTASTRDGYMALQTRTDNSMTEKVRITSAGEVGIGTTTPKRSLNVNSGSASTGIWLDSTTLTSNLVLNDTGGYSFIENTGGAFSISVENGTVADTFYINELGNVGIGDSNPASLLHITGSTDPEIRFENSDSSDVWHIISEDSTNQLRFSESGSGIFELVLDSGVGVGIADDAPDDALSVGGDIDASGSMEATAFCPDGLSTCDPTTAEAFTANGIGATNIYAGSGGEVDFQDNINLNDNTIAGLGSMTSTTDQNIVMGADTNLIFDLDDDNDGSNEFLIRDGANTEVLAIDESGNLQMDGNLQVDGTTITLIDNVIFNVAGENMVRIDNNGTQVDFRVGDIATARSFTLSKEHAGTDGDAYNMDIYYSDHATSEVGEFSIHASRDSGAYFTIESNGEIGIGTANPTDLLDVNGGVIIRDRAAIQGSGATCSAPGAGTAGWWYSDAGDCGTVFAGLETETNGAEVFGIFLGAWRFEVDTSGNVQADGNINIDGTGSTIANGLNLEAGEFQVGGTDYGGFEIQATGQGYFSDYLRADGGLTTGSTDPGTGNLHVAQRANISQVIYGTIHTASITTKQDDYNPTGLSTATVIFFDSDCSTRCLITGIAGGVDGRRLILVNVGTSPIRLVDQGETQGTDSAAANRFAMGQNITVSPTGEAGLEVMYDGAASRWRYI